MGQPILPPTVLARRDGSLVQLPTGFVFPLTIASLTRLDVRIFDASGHSMGATYRASPNDGMRETTSRVGATIRTIPGDVESCTATTKSA